MYIPENKITEILNVSDIVDIISDAVTLKRSGRNYFGLCPFHSEKTPSFSVSPEKRIFHCFGCGAGGNAFSFIMKYHGLSFPEAASMLAGKYGIVFETADIDPSRKRKMALKETLFRVNAKVRDFFKDQLDNGPGARNARLYLERRGITKETMEYFSLGYAPNAWESAVGLLRKMKLSKSVAEASGLVLKRDNGRGYYDRFRNRIIFPIVDMNMQVAGFGGRVMDDAMPKYLNSPETPVYSKGKVLYGFSAARHYCRGKGSVYIVEGYFDFLSLFQGGIKNCVATLGTALTTDHVRILKGCASRIILLFDSDNAGVNAAARGVELFMNEGVDARIMVLPKGHDPDSFFQKYGRDAFESAAGDAMGIMEFLTGRSIELHGLSIEGKMAVIGDMAPYLAGVGDSAARSLYIRELAHRIGIDEKALLDKVAQIVHEQGNKAMGIQGKKAMGIQGKTLFRGGDMRTPAVPMSGVPASCSMEYSRGEDGYPVMGAADGPHYGFPGAAGTEKREAQMISMMIQFPGIVEDVENRQVVESFFSDRLKSLAGLVIKVVLAGDVQHVASDVMALADRDEDRELIASLAMMEVIGGEDIAEKAACLMNRIVRIRKKYENSLINEIRQKEKESCNGNDLPLDLLRQRQMEIRKLRGYE
ncbi:MAG: DNA primase [Desulfamplus sp.]|nr:DNA primase [Desulfamplus sp.]